MKMDRPLVQTLLRTCAKFRRSEQGGVAIVAGLSAVLLVSIAGVAADEVRLARASSSLQTVLDGATLAAAAPLNMSDTQRTATANAYLDSRMGNVPGFTSVKRSVAVKGNRVYVKDDGTVVTAFMRILGFNRMSLTRISVSERTTKLGCMIVLDPTAPQSLYLNGTADTYANKCVVQVNSSSSTALKQVGSSTLTAESICVTGGSSGQNFTPTPQTCKAVPDPLAANFATDFATYDTSVCDQYNGNGKSMLLGSGTTNLKPGVYCGGVKVTNGSIGVLAPGIYFIKDGELNIKSGGTVTGTGGVTIVLMGNSTTDLNVQAGGNLQLKAPASGAFAGIAIAHHPASIPSSSSGDLVIGGGSIDVEGIIYTPKQLLTITGNGDISMNAKQFAMIANMISIQGNGELRIGQGADAAGSGLPSLPSAGQGGVRILPDSSYIASY
jgi:Flp pilus assembly protein TadG